MFSRENGSAALNMFHEMAQLLALYVTKHIHGISDDERDVILVAFDRHHRSNGRLDGLLSSFSKHPVVFDEDVPIGTCYANALLAFAGEEGIAFWHKFVRIGKNRFVSNDYQTVILPTCLPLFLQTTVPIFKFHVTGLLL